MQIIKIYKQIWKGKSLARALLNLSFVDIKLVGKVLDVGGARNPDYFEYFDTSGMTKSSIVDGKIEKVDFEIDKLPFLDNSFDTTICANVFEHIYNHNHLAKEICRVTKTGSNMVGFVPFLVQYHPDPHDYFRYTDEALRRIFVDAGFSSVDIRVVGLGPIGAHFHNICLGLPRFIRIVSFPAYYFFSCFTLLVKPAFLKRFPLGYTFICKK